MENFNIDPPSKDSVQSGFSVENIALDLSSMESVIEAKRRIKDCTESILSKIENAVDDSTLHDDLQAHTADLRKEIETFGKVQKEVKIFHELQKESIQLIRTDNAADQSTISVTENLFDIQKQMTRFARLNLSVKNANQQDMPTTKEEEQSAARQLMQLQSENIELMKNVEGYQRKYLIDIQTNITRFWSSILTTQDLHKHEENLRKDSGCGSATSTDLAKAARQGLVLSQSMLPIVCVDDSHREAKDEESDISVSLTSDCKDSKQ